MLPRFFRLTIHGFFGSVILVDVQSLLKIFSAFPKLYLRGASITDVLQSCRLSTIFSKVREFFDFFGSCRFRGNRDVVWAFWLDLTFGGQLIISSVPLARKDANVF